VLRGSNAVGDLIDVESIKSDRPWRSTWLGTDT
jgi:hypothetical protein